MVTPKCQDKTERIRCDSQGPDGENGTQLELLLFGHVEAPDREDWYD